MYVVIHTSTSEWSREVVYDGLPAQDKTNLEKDVSKNLTLYDDKKINLESNSISEVSSRGEDYS